MESKGTSEAVELQEQSVIDLKSAGTEGKVREFRGILCIHLKL